jgi:hypothetical protein
MNKTYEIIVDLERKTIKNEGNEIYNASDEVDPSVVALQFIVDDKYRKLEFYQDVNNIKNIFTSDVDTNKLLGNIVKLNLAINEAFDSNFILTFQELYDSAIEIHAINELKAYHNLVKFFYACKRGILITYTLLKLQEQLIPEDSNNVNELKTKETELKTFLRDSVQLIMNTGEFVRNNAS